MARHKLSKEQQIKGCRKALANPRTPKQFLPGLKKRLKKLLGALILAALIPSFAHAQFQGYVSPQTVQQNLASSLACTGSNQTFVVTNLGQTQHYATLNGVGVTSLNAQLFGIDTAGNIIAISDVLEGAPGGATSSLAGSGYFARVELVVNCSPGTATFSATYSGASATSNVTAGGYQSAQIDKLLSNSSAAGSNLNIASFQTPFGSSGGSLIFQYSGAGIAGSTLLLQCLGSTGFNFSETLAVANSGSAQVFPIPTGSCPKVQVAYTSGGATAQLFSLEYQFTAPGIEASSTASSLTATLNNAANLVEKGSRWGTQVSSPGAGSQATTSKAAGTNGVRHVADCVTWSAGAIAAPAATLMSVNLRDGASGAGTVIWQTQVTAAATAAQHGQGYICGLNLIGSPNTAMTLEFNALVANEAQSVALTGYDVQ